MTAAQHHTVDCDIDVAGKSNRATRARQSAPITGDELLIPIGAVDAAVVGMTLQTLAQLQRGKVHDSALERMQRVGDALVRTAMLHGPIEPKVPR
jgi:hypothetical protein